MNLEQHAPIKHTAFFRFYEELNDFLPEAQRKIRFPYAFTGKPSAKDTIEAIGVPHTEIDLILVDGVSVDFDYQLSGGEQVSVYPVFESLDITPLVRLRARPLRETRFVVDVNLGKLAQKLRLLGFDTLFSNDLKDSEIVSLSLEEKRVILTRDKGILKRNAVTHGYWVRNDDPDVQVKEVVDRLQLDNAFKPFFRCSSCNGLLSPIDKADIKSLVPNGALQSIDFFVECCRCKKVYWQGSHYDRINQWINKLKNR